MHKTIICYLVFSFLSGCAVLPTREDMAASDLYLETMRVRHNKMMEEKYGSDWTKKIGVEDQNEEGVLIEHYDQKGRKIGHSIRR